MTFLTEVPPQFTGGGSVIRAAATVSALARDHDVHVVVIRRKFTLENMEPNRALLEMGVEFSEVPGTSLRMAGSLRRNLVETLAIAAPGLANRLLPRFGVPVIDRPQGALWIFKSTLFEGRRLPAQARVVVDLDDLEERVIGSARSPRLVFRRWRAIGRRTRALRVAMCSLVCSELDRRRLGDHPRVAVLGNTYLLPDSGPTGDGASAAAPGAGPVIGMVGRMSYDPNREGAQWFAEHCWPVVRRAVPDARCQFIGLLANQLAVAEGNGVEMIEAPPDIVAVLRDVDVSIVPVLRGSGTRVKILEAMALGKPVVSTTLGAEGIDVTDGVDILIGDTPEAFAAAVTRLLRDPVLARSIADNGHRLFEARYSFDRFAEAVAHILPPVSSTTPR